MNRRSLTISSIDRYRLELLVRDEVARGGTPRERLCALKSKLDDAEVLQGEKMPRDVVTMNSTVRLRDMDTGDIQTYTLVYPGFGNIAEGCLSVLTPLGAAILGHRKGDVAESETPLATSRMQIEDVEFQPESVGQYDV